MGDHFYYGQKDLIRQLNQLALAKDIIDIPQNSAAAAASAADSAAAAAAAAESDGAAAIAASKAETAFKSLDARYLGAKALPPDVDNNGDALLAGATYWDTALNGGCLRVFQAGAWVTIPANIASQVASTPVGGIVAANVQAALAELDTKKAVRATTLAGYGITDALPSAYAPTWVSITGKPQFAAVATSGSKGDVGLGRVDNTADQDKPVSTAQKAALDLKADKVSLSKVDNTADQDKPVSTAQKAALDLKAPIENPVVKASLTVDSANTLRIIFKSGDTMLGGIGSDATYCFRAADKSGVTYVLRVTNSGNVEANGSITASGSVSGTSLVASQSGTGQSIIGLKLANGLTRNHILDSGTSADIFWTNTSGAAVAGLSNSGNMWAANISSPSDERLKYDWLGLPTNWLDDLAGVKCGTYMMYAMGDPDVRHIGVSAQEIREVSPESVYEDSHGLLTVNYAHTALTAAIMLAREVKELRAMLAACATKS